MNETMPQHAPTDKGPDKQIVLVVDARPIRQFYTSIFLQRLKYQVIMAKTAEDALLLLGLTIPLIVIANYDLPQMTGLELLKRMKHAPRTRNVPFIVYTSNGSPKVRQDCEEAGCSAFLCHPCSLEELYAAVQKTTRAKPRRFVRLTTALDVIVEDGRSPDDASNNIITAISERGMFVSTAVPLAIGKILPFAFHLPNAPGWLIRVEGQVLFNHVGAKKRQIPGMAVKFLQIGDQEREFVREFIKQELMEGINPDHAQAIHHPGLADRFA
ncbi:MAG TPA: response regulator [Nitrospirota bacterium]|nr:response regulator [Nitrospirota bacterium]